MPAVDPQARPISADSGVSVTSAAAAREETAEQARDNSAATAQLLVKHLPKFFEAHAGDSMEMIYAFGERAGRAHQEPALYGCRALPEPPPSVPPLRARRLPGCCPVLLRHWPSAPGARW